MDHWRSVVDGELSGAGVRKAAFAVFRVFLNALLCGPWGLGFGLPRSGFASGAFRFHLDSFYDLIDARLAIGGLGA